MARRINRIERMENDFMDLELKDQDSLLRVLQGLHRQKLRNGAALADKPLTPVQQASLSTGPIFQMPIICSHGMIDPRECSKCVAEALLL